MSSCDKGLYSNRKSEVYVFPLGKYICTYSCQSDKLPVSLVTHDKTRRKFAFVTGEFCTSSAYVLYTVETLYSTIYYSKYFIELNFDKST